MNAANGLGNGRKVFVGAVGALMLLMGTPVRADLPLPHTGSADVNAPLLRLTNTNGGTNAWAFRGTGTYGFVGDSSVIGGAGARGTFFDANSGAARASGNLGRAVAVGRGALYYGIWGKLFPESDGAAVYGTAESLFGNAAFFEIVNPKNELAAVDARSNGGGYAVRAENTGLGLAGQFRITNPNNNNSALYASTTGTGRAGQFWTANSASTAAALSAETFSQGHAAFFSIHNSDSTAATLRATTGGKGRAGLFQIFNSTSTANALEARSNGASAGQAVYARHLGLGDCAVFEITNSGSAGEAVEARTNGSGNAVESVNTGTGRAGWFEVSNSASFATALDARHNGKGVAVQGRHSGTLGNAGVFRNTNSSNPLAAMFATHDGGGPACNCAGDSLVGGDLDVTGGLTPSAAAIKVDHPLDPANRYLQLPAVHSAEMRNMFNGVIVLDEHGEGWVELPEWFEAANRDFTYHLTPIGAPAPALYVAQEIQNNAFLIAGGSAGLKVSWQVTGIRQDPYALQHAIAVEADKPAHEVGFYRHPEAYGLPEAYRLRYDEHAGAYQADSTDGEGFGEASERGVVEED